MIDPIAAAAEDIVTLINERPQTPTQTEIVRVIEDAFINIHERKPYLISQDKLNEVLTEAATLTWDTVEWRDGKWVWVHG